MGGLTDDRRVRYRRHSTGLTVLWHPCEICGDTQASFGYEFGDKSKEHKGLGRWFCFKDRPATDYHGNITKQGSLI